MLLLASVVGLCGYYAIRSDPKQEVSARKFLKVGRLATLIFLVFLFLSPLINEILSTLGCFFLALESLALSTMTLFINVYYFIRFDPKKAERARQAYNVSVSAGILFFLLLFVYIAIV